MRNATIYGTGDLIDRFLSALRGLGPRDSLNKVSLQKTGADGAADARIRWQVAGRSFDLSLDVKVSPPAATPAYLRTIYERGGIPVVVAPFLSRPMQEKLERTGVSYWDPTGNLLLQSRDPFMWVKEQGATKNPNPEPVGTALRSLKGRSASEVVVLLLANGGAATVRDLARESGISLGTVSRVVSLLRDEDLLEPTGGGPIVVRDQLRLAQRWTDEYSFAKTFKARSYFSILGSSAALARIQESGQAYAVTGLAAQSLWYQAEARVAPLPSSELWLYTDDVERIVEIADLVPDSANGTIMVAQADFLGPGRESYRSVGDTRTAWPWRVVGDLMSLSGRYAAAGADFAGELTNRKAGADA